MFTSGDEATILEGPFQGKDGTIEEIDHEQAVAKVSVVFFGRPQTIEVSLDALSSKADVSAYRAKLEEAIRRYCVKSLVAWFSTQHATSDDEISALFDLAQQKSRELEDSETVRAIWQEFDDSFSGDARSSDRFESLWRKRNQDWLSRLQVPDLDDAARDRAFALMGRVNDARKAQEEADID